MPRNMSFALTTEQVQNRTKTVTRRLGWQFLKRGDFVQPVVKAQGITKGGMVERIGPPVHVVDVRREALSMLLLRHDAQEECQREGFPHLTPKQFVAMFVEHLDCFPNSQVTRIEFEYL